MTKPLVRSEDDAKRAVKDWFGKPEHVHPKPGQDELTASDDVDAPEHNERTPHVVTDPKEDEE